MQMTTDELMLAVAAARDLASRLSNTLGLHSSAFGYCTFWDQVLK